MKRIIVTLVIALFAAACGGNGDDAAEGTEGGAQEIDVAAVDIAYEPDEAEVSAGDSLIVNLTNEGNLQHDLVLEDGTGTGMLAPGESETVELGPFDESATAYCTEPGHREAGMEFDIVVTD